MTGALVVDKPAGCTSHDVVNRIRRITGLKKVGHLGTLDPLATGVLPLLIGRATRLAQFFGKNDKCYQATVRFGWATDSYDSDGEPAAPPQEVHLTDDRVESILASFRGEFLQTPPPVSAKKVGGQPAYKLARKKMPVELEPVPIIVHDLTITGIDGPDVHLHIRCSAGTYVRAIAHEAGQMLGCGAHLSALRRTASGPFTESQAVTIDSLQALAAQGRLAEVLLPAIDLLPEFPIAVVDELTEGHIRNGREFRVSPFRARPGTRYLKAASRQGDLIAIGEERLPNLYQPVLVL